MEKGLIPDQHNPQEFGYLVAERINHFKYIHENVYKQESQFYFNSVQNEGSVPSMYFTRCSNWQTNKHIERKNFKKGKSPKNTISTRF